MILFYRNLIILYSIDKLDVIGIKLHLKDISIHVIALYIPLATKIVSFEQLFEDIERACDFSK